MMDTDTKKQAGLSEPAIYVATHSQPVPETGDFFIPIQTGAALSNVSICSVGDHTGDHISRKNREFSELTALYWIWKNDRHSIVGLCHYRRRFQITPEQVFLLLTDHDLIIPPPYYFRRSLRDEYETRHTKNDLDLLLRVMHRLHPEMDKTLQTVLNQNRLIPYNMMITRRELLCEYCQWLFPILFEVEANLPADERSDYQRRVFGFLSERLFTAYIEERALRTCVCPTAIPETTTFFRRLKYACGRKFNQLYFKWVKQHE